VLCVRVQLIVYVIESGEMKQRERLFFVYMKFSLRSFEKSIRTPSKYICNICERVQSGKEKELYFEQRHSE